MLIPAPACSCLLPLAPACSRLLPLAPACSPLAPACSRLISIAPACHRLSWIVPECSCLFPFASQSPRSMVKKRVGAPGEVCIPCKVTKLCDVFVACCACSCVYAHRMHVHMYKCVPHGTCIDILYVWNAACCSAHVHLALSLCCHIPQRFLNQQ